MRSLRNRSLNLAPNVMAICSSQAMVLALAACATCWHLNTMLFAVSGPARHPERLTQAVAAGTVEDKAPTRRLRQQTDRTLHQYASFESSFATSCACSSFVLAFAVLAAKRRARHNRIQRPRAVVLAAKKKGRSCQRLQGDCVAAKDRVLPKSKCHKAGARAPRLLADQQSV